MRPAPPVVSVLLPTYHRPHHLPRTLAALATQALDVDWELVVVDNDPAGSARHQVESAGTDFAVPVRYVLEPRRGAAAARNRGLEEVRGEVVAMIDDDVVPAADWLRTLVAPLLAGEAEGSGGRVLLDPSVVRPRWFDENLLGGLVSHFDPIGPGRPLRDGELVLTANAAFRTAALRATGGFDPRLGPSGDRHMVNDDLQVVRDLQRRGSRLVLVPAAVVVHELPDQRISVRWLLRRAWWQGRSDWVLDRPDYEQRRFNGARIAVTHGLMTLLAQLREGRFDSAHVVRIACDLAKTAGRLAEARSW
ncbi:MAG: kfoC 1 [Frankiales bacterium]|nr:kfoC 1 [Frankiales bacterium]